MEVLLQTILQTENIAIIVLATVNIWQGLILRTLWNDRLRIHNETLTALKSVTEAITAINNNVISALIRKKNTDVDI